MPRHAHGCGKRKKQDHADEIEEELVNDERDEAQPEAGVGNGGTRYRPLASLLSGRSVYCWRCRR